MNLPAVGTQRAGLLFADVVFSGNGSELREHAAIGVRFSFLGTSLQVFSRPGNPQRHDGPLGRGRSTRTARPEMHGAERAIGPEREAGVHLRLYN